MGAIFAGLAAAPACAINRSRRQTGQRAFIAVDDLRPGLALRHELVQTPHIDSLAAAGAVERAYASFRSAILRGRAC
jgi:hypothetical protein